MATLHETHSRFDDLFKVEGVHPPLLKSFLGGRICLETLTIFNKIFQYVPQFDKQIKEEIVWKPLRNKVVKYDPFLHIDMGKYKKIVKAQYL